MALTPGTRLGPYEVAAQIGEGGMGQVYRARDTKLNRDVALKVLPDSFANDPDRLARFTREAQTLASLNHPNIAGIYGLEEGGGTTALVMELVEGEDLSQRIARGAIPIDEALPIAKQIAEALEAAHEQGIIHRDLKPANIKVRPDGTVKVLDFGLAKLVAAPAAASRVGLSQSPTITTPAMMTGVGVILGTAAYMSPEQAKGREADKRSDVWAFGAVLYEMLTGKRAFESEDVSDTLAAVLRGEPDWSALPVNVPPAIRTLLKRCLGKDRSSRVAEFSTALFVMSEPALGASPSASTAQMIAPPSLRRHLAINIAIAAAAAGVAVAGTGFFLRPAPSRVTRTTITPSASAALALDAIPDLTVTPDGSHVVYVGNSGLFARALDALDPVAIASGEALRNPFVSPDGLWVGFFDHNVLKKVALSGGPTLTVTRSDGIGPRGATWAPDDTILFATNNLATGLQRVPAAGGTPTVLTHADQAHGETDHLWPEVLPGGRAVLFTITTQTGGVDALQVAVLDLRTGSTKVLVRGGGHAHYVRSGHLVYIAAGALRAVPFDLTRLETRGTGVAAVPTLRTMEQGAGDFAVGTDGTLVYANGPSASTGRALVWVDRAGKEESIPTPPRYYSYPSLSPDGTRLALTSVLGDSDLWLWDFARAMLTRLTAEPGIDQEAVWTPDGRRIVFASDRAGGVRNLWWLAADGAGTAERLTTSPHNQSPTGISPDGTQVLFEEDTPTMGRDLMRLALDSSHRVTPLLQTKFNERNGTVSPDGRWLAYESDSLQRPEIYVRPFPGTDGGPWQVSSTGGTKPSWARSGQELFYVGPDSALLRVSVEAKGGTWNAGLPIRLFDGRYEHSNPYRNYDISPDGQRFLLIKKLGADQAGPAPGIIVVQHWDEELKRLVPTK